MEIIAGPLDWTSVDSENLVRFLDTETGKRLLPKLADSVPGLLPAGDTNAILIRSGEVLGWQSVARMILDLAHPSQPVSSPQQSYYPNLEDDAQWNDGQAIVKSPDKTDKPL